MRGFYIVMRARRERVKNTFSVIFFLRTNSSIAQVYFLVTTGNAYFCSSKIQQVFVAVEIG